MTYGSCQLIYVVHYKISQNTPQPYQEGFHFPIQSLTIQLFLEINQPGYFVAYVKIALTIL